MGKTFEIHITEEGFVYSIYKGLFNFNKNENENNLKMGKTDLTLLKYISGQ